MGGVGREGVQCSRPFFKAFNQFYLYAKPRETRGGGENKKKKKEKTKHIQGRKKKKNKLLPMLKLSIH